jgi:tetratricopeptide (TPR) repeat protein
VGKLALGRTAEAEADILNTLRLSPRDTFAYHWIFFVGVAKEYLGNDEEAVTWLCKSIDTNPNFSLSHFNLAAALANLGRIEEARTAVRTGLAVNSNFIIRSLRNLALGDNPILLAQRTHIFEGMRKAGVPEG